MEKTYMSQYGKIVKRCPGLHEYWYHGWLLAKGSGLSSTNPDCAPTDEDWEFCKEYLNKHKAMATGGDADNASYGQQVFVDMVFDYCGDHAPDDNWIGEDGEYPDVCRDTIEYDPDSNEWAVYCKFASSGVWVEMIGDADGFVRMETQNNPAE